MLELTLILIAAAGILLLLLRPLRKRSVSRAERAAREAVEARLNTPEESPEKDEVR